ncbi:DUF7455 domain-containing protein [Mangrovihabitans endophyticus]|uniref:DUF7455 domain-containing protein n=1 Tax=Mangrovihabitans endophyticus TaxID=1751298 RepID=A0A8J3BW47_9ACTN|nr:hypothetical protein [Mangrovihabitans endophyticus]GGK83056.1 hypothetical protein GCM10012284_16490 [Mangrovihabitans endophyticus]
MNTLISTPTITVVPELTERCDGCGAAAKMEVTLRAGTLAFCGHHATRHADGLNNAATAIRVVEDFIWS